METRVVQYHSWRWAELVECGWVTMHVREDGWATMVRR